MTRALVFVVVLGACGPSYTPDHPIAFDHALHLALAVDGKPLGCTDCHAGAERAEHAGLPALRECLRCHVKPQLNERGDANPREARVRELAVPGPFRWTQVTRNPGHVYAPHRAHVGIAKLECAECHGDVASWRAPPTRPNERLTRMSECIACHRQRGAPTTCGTCHR
jgi:hypothetical protein